MLCECPKCMPFQTKELIPEYQLECPACKGLFRHPCRGSLADPVEEKIKLLHRRYGGDHLNCNGKDNCQLQMDLNSLVILARQSGTR